MSRDTEDLRVAGFRSSEELIEWQRQQRAAQQPAEQPELHCHWPSCPHGSECIHAKQPEPSGLTDERIDELLAAVDYNDSGAALARRFARAIEREVLATRNHVVANGLSMYCVACKRPYRPSRVVAPFAAPQIGSMPMTPGACECGSTQFEGQVSLGAGPQVAVAHTPEPSGLTYFHRACLEELAQRIDQANEAPIAISVSAAVAMRALLSETYKRSPEEVARIMEAVERFGRACMQCDANAVKATRAEVERLLKGEE